MDHVRALDGDQPAQAKRGGEIGVIADAQRTRSSVRARHRGGERRPRRRGEDVLVTALHEMTDETRHLPFATTERALRIDVQDLQAGFL